VSTLSPPETSVLEAKPRKAHERSSVVSAAPALSTSERPSSPKTSAVVMAASGGR